MAFDELNIQARDLPAPAWQPERQEFVAQAYYQAADRKIELANQALSKAEQRLKELRSAKSPGNGPNKSDNSSTAVEPFSDNFDGLNEQHWRNLGGQWVHEAGVLKQLTDGPTRSVLRLLKPVRPTSKRR